MCIYIHIHIYCIFWQDTIAFDLAGLTCIHCSLLLLLHEWCMHAFTHVYIHIHLQCAAGHFSDFNATVCLSCEPGYVCPWNGVSMNIFCVHIGVGVSMYMFVCMYKEMTILMFLWVYACQERVKCHICTDLKMFMTYTDMWTDNCVCAHIQIHPCTVFDVELHVWSSIKVMFTCQTIYTADPCV